MLKYAIVSLIAGLFGFTGLAAGTATIAKALFVIFLAMTVIFVILAILGVCSARKILK